MPQIDKYTHSEDPNIVAGACIGFGLCCCCVHSELDPAFALISEHVHSDESAVRVASVMALGLAYAGTAKEDVRELLLPLVAPEEASVELVAYAALSLGLVYAGTCDGVSMPISRAFGLWFWVLVLTKFECSGPILESSR
jgi:26S proteasome regulatory subunit N1